MGGGRGITWCGSRRGSAYTGSTEGRTLLGEGAREEVVVEVEILSGANPGGDGACEGVVEKPARRFFFFF